MSKWRGLTLIELLAGLAVTAMVLVCLLQIVNAIVSDDRVFGDESGTWPPPWTSAVREYMQADLDQSLLVRISTETIVIEGWRDQSEVATDHDAPRAVRVVYRIVNPGSALLREQRSIGRHVGIPPSTELIAMGIKGWTRNGPHQLMLTFHDAEQIPVELELPASVEEGPVF
ncbi:MAG: hypothetical protein AAGJ38_00715 [Planctomycetota bacterium]